MSPTARESKSPTAWGLFPGMGMNVIPGRASRAEGHWPRNDLELRETDIKSRHRTGSKGEGREASRGLQGRRLIVHFQGQRRGKARWLGLALLSHLSQ